MKIATVVVSALLILSVQAELIGFDTRGQLVKSGPAGGTGGKPFDDTDVINKGFINHYDSVLIAHNKRIDGIGIVFSQNQIGLNFISPKHGSLTGNDGRTVTIIAVTELDVTDPIIKVNVRTNKGKVVGMDLVQKTGKVTVVGSTEGNPNPMEAPQPDMGLVGFHGRAGDEIDSLGVIWAKTSPLR